MKKKNFLSKENFSAKKTTQKNKEVSLNLAKCKYSIFDWVYYYIFSLEFRVHIQYV